MKINAKTLFEHIIQNETIMWKSQLLSLFLGLLFVYGSDGIECYKCGPPCPSTSSGTVDVVTCDKYCKTANVNGKVAKGCASPYDPLLNSWTSSTTNGIDIHYCTCDWNKCNAALKPTFGVGLISSFILMCLCNALI